MAFITAFFVGVFASIGASAAVAAALGAAATRIVIGLALSAVSRALTPKPIVPEVQKQQIQATINQAAGPRTRLYGQALMGGTRAFWETSGGKLYQIVVMNHGPLTARLNYWMDGKRISVDGAGEVLSDPFAGSVNLAWKNGVGDGGDYADVRSTFPSLWTSAHDLTGQATVKAVFTLPEPAAYSRIFPRGAGTNVQIEAQGAAVYDYRTTTTAYSDNAALVIADYLTHADGYRIPAGKIDTSMFSTFANACDQAIPLNAGGTEKRYRLWGVYSLQEPPKSVLERMTIACDASIFQTAEGKVGIIGGQFSEPDVTITDADIYSLEKVDGNNGLDGFNVLKAIYTSGDHDYQDTEAQSWEDTAALLTQPEKSHEIQLDMSPANGQTRRLMKIEYNKLNRKWTGRLVTSLVGIKARFPKGDGVHTIRVQYADLGMDEVVEVLGHALTAEKGPDGVIIWKCAIDVASIETAWRTWNAATEESASSDAPAIPGPDGVPVPVISSLTQVREDVARVEIDNPSRRDLELEAQIRPTGETEWNAMSAAMLRADSGSLDLGSYDVRVRFKGGEWSAISTITIV